MPGGALSSYGYGGASNATNAGPGYLKVTSTTGGTIFESSTGQTTNFTLS
jgi:hypothetical protein